MDFQEVALTESQLEWAKDNAPYFYSRRDTLPSELG